jgi:hypothetical protein
MLHEIWYHINPQHSASFVVCPIYPNRHQSLAQRNFLDGFILFLVLLYERIPWKEVALF